MKGYRVFMIGLGAYRVGRSDRSAWHPVARVFPTAEKAAQWMKEESRDERD